MLPAANRLKDKKTISRLFQSGYSIYGKIIFLRYQKNIKPDSPPKIAIAIGVKTAPLATDRNRLKRLIQAILRDLINKIPPGFDFVIGINNKTFRLVFLKDSNFRKVLLDDIKTAISKVRY